MINGTTIITGWVNNPTWMNSSALATSAKSVALIKVLRLGMCFATSSWDALTCSSREKDDINANLPCGYAHKAMARISGVSLSNYLSCYFGMLFSQPTNIAAGLFVFPWKNIDKHPQSSNHHFALSRQFLMKRSNNKKRTKRVTGPKKKLYAKKMACVLDILWTPKTMNI